jgi:hypothetical protein
MVGQRDNRFALPGDDGRQSRMTGEGAALQERNGNSSRSLTVKCPNPDCGMIQTVPAGWAGKKGSCPNCESTFFFPLNSASTLAVSSGSPSMQSRETSPARNNAESDFDAQPHEAQQQVAIQPAIVRAGCIGRGNAGKTALFRALADGTIGDFLPSGLSIDAGDPREVARLIHEAEETQRLLHRAGLPPTLVASQIQYYLYEGAEQRVAFQMQEVIGQVLTHTLPDSAADLHSRYNDYLLTLVNTQVLWAVVPCPPPNPGSRERRRYANDLRITLAYLREALRLRQSAEPVAVALVLSKIDTLYRNSDEARAALPDNVLRGVLGPLVDLIETSKQVYAGTIFPVTAFGFGNAVVKEHGDREGITADTTDEPFGDEPVWILRDGADARPFNLDALFLWTLLYGLQDPNTANQGIRSIGLKLEEDLNAANPWNVVLK